MITNEYCPQCGRESDSSRVRLVQDSCGHKKCRECLLSEEAGCLSCSSSSNPVFTELRPLLQPAPDVIPDKTIDACIPPTFIETNCNSDSVPQASLDVSNASKKEDSLTMQPMDTQKVLDDECLESQDKAKQIDTENNVSLKKRPTYGLKEHIVFTPGEPPKYFCKKCRKSYNNRKAARYHNYCGASNTEKPHTCHVCGQGFVTKGHFTYHMKSHTGFLPYMCKLCGKGFKQLSKLKRHSKSHDDTPEKPFKCDQCGKTFVSNQTLKDHKLSHSDSHFVSCPICDKKLSSKSCLRKHNKLHAEPIHKCSHCAKKFSVKWSLDVHLKSHLWERKFKCKLCNRAFKILSDLKRHAVVHQEDGEWDCELCNLVFRRRDNLIRHIKNIHPESKLNLSMKHGTVRISEKESNEISNPEENASKAPASISQAVSVIRGPVIQKAQSVLFHGCSQSLDSVVNRVEENSVDHWQIHSEQESENVRNVNQNESNPSKDQNYQRQSVVCHSGGRGRGIVHYGSSAPEYVCEVNHTVSQSASELNAWVRNSSSEVEDSLSHCNALQRPRVIVEKSFICDNS